MLNRRELIRGVLGSGALLATGGCRQSVPLPPGEMLAPNLSLGHRLRDGKFPPVSREIVETIPVAIVGGGMAGLSAAWCLQRAGLADFQLFELESQPGGTSTSGEHAIARFPWGAHYVPVPMPEHQALVTLLTEMDVIAGQLPDGHPRVREQYLCRDPEERLFMDGRWIPGIYPAHGASAEDLAQLAAFREEVGRWADRRDAAGRRMFAIPMSQGSDGADVRALDELSMQDWLVQQGWDSHRLHWLVDYACRDDYGLSPAETSAWAGMFYFASRRRSASSESQPLITWPEGNGRVVRHLAGRVADQLQTGQAVLRIECGSETGPAELLVWDVRQDRGRWLRAERVIFAAPQFLAPHVIADWHRDTQSFQYGSWIVAQLELADRPGEHAFPLCWDNVLYESPSLGYVVATHQSGRDHGPTIFSWYYPLIGTEPGWGRERLLRLSREEWAEVALSDLERAHPEIRRLTKRLDVMRWGHAMIQPRPGFVWSDERRQARLPWRALHFAGTDLSGIALLEEALDHGVRAAEEVLQSRAHTYQSLRVAGSG